MRTPDEIGRVFSKVTNVAHLSRSRVPSPVFKIVRKEWEVLKADLSKRFRRDPRRTTKSDVFERELQLHADGETSS